MKRLRFLKFLVLALPLLPGPAREAGAADGVIQINQARALAGGVTAGDAPGFPVQITETAHYILTSNLDVTGETNPESVTVITVTAPGGATIDLNGFGILGTTLCTGAPVTSCTPTGTGVGILFTSPIGLIRGGTVSGMGYRGIDMSAAQAAFIQDVSVHYSGENGMMLPTASLVDRILVTSNGGVGIQLGAGSAIRDSEVYNNADNGIEIADGSQVRETISNGNGGAGISMGASVSVESCTTNGNGSGGITSTYTGIVRNSVAVFNTTDGIHVGATSTLMHNNSLSNTDDGVEAGVYSVVIGNVVNGNSGYGLNLGTGTGYQGNVVSNNTSGTVNGTGLVEMGDNACNGSATCP